jgi:CPA2 family monovalent cation:H+ antiporter-2
MRDAFAVLFFVSVGMLFDPKSLIEVPHIIGLVLLVVIVIKPIAAIATVKFLGEPRERAIPIGAAFSQVGEFSFILGTVAMSLGILNAAGWNALVASSIISIAANPYVYRWARRMAHNKKSAHPPPEKHTKQEIQRKRCILIGYGPVGRLVHQLLIDRGAEVVVIDLNLDAVRELQKAGHSAIYGDVRQPGTLVEAGIQTTETLILSADIDDALDVIKQADELNPELRVLARCSHLREVAALSKAGADFVAAGEAEVGVALAEAVNELGKEGLKDHAERQTTIRRQLYDSAHT